MNINEAPVPGRSASIMTVAEGGNAISIFSGLTITDSNNVKCNRANAATRGNRLTPIYREGKPMGNYLTVSNYRWF